MSGLGRVSIVAAAVAALCTIILVASQQATPAGAAQRGGSAAAGVGVVPPAAASPLPPCWPRPSCPPKTPVPKPTPTPAPTPQPTPVPKVVATYTGPLEVTVTHWTEAYVACGYGQLATGGGWTGINPMPDTDVDHPVVVMANRPAIRVGQSGSYSYPEPAAGGGATGWYVALYNPEGGTNYRFRAWAMCLRP
jgi:hypothetical protein